MLSEDRYRPRNAARVRILRRGGGWREPGSSNGLKSGTGSSQLFSQIARWSGQASVRPPDLGGTSALRFQAERTCPRMIASWSTVAGSLSITVENGRRQVADVPAACLGRSWLIRTHQRWNNTDSRACHVRTAIRAAPHPAPIGQDDVRRILGDVDDAKTIQILSLKAEPGRPRGGCDVACGGTPIFSPRAATGSAAPRRPSSISPHLTRTRTPRPSAEERRQAAESRRKCLFSGQ
jgi:hypothetical protein